MENGSMVMGIGPHLPDDFFVLRSGLSLAQSKSDLFLGKLLFLHAELSSS